MANYRTLLFSNPHATSTHDFQEAWEAYKKEYIAENEMLWSHVVPEPEPLWDEEYEETKQIREKLESWYNLYEKLHDNEKLRIYPSFEKEHKVSDDDSGVLYEGIVMFVNGQNGFTKISRQSLNHVMDFIKFWEDNMGGRAWIESTSTYSDVYYYVIRFMTWKDTYTPLSANDNITALTWVK